MIKKLFTFKNKILYKNIKNYIIQYLYILKFVIKLNCLFMI